MTKTNRTGITPGLPAAIASVDHTGITVSSLDEALDFWLNALGFQHLYTWTFENTPFIEKLVGVSGAALLAVDVRRCDERCAPKV